MRTTVTLDPDVEQLLRERMEAKGVSFKQALNEAIRESSSAPRADYVFETKSRPMGFNFDITKANQIAGDLEDAEILAKLREGR